MENKIEELASLVLDFGKVDRITAHQDGVFPESDTDHTVMLGVIGVSLAKRLYNDLDLGLIAQFALVHDLVEVYAGDMPTLVDVNHGFLQEKEERERSALNRIKNEFGEDFSWAYETIEKYEAMDTKEARFVKTLDKILPKVTVILNKAKAIKNNKLGTREGIIASQKLQKEKLEKISYDMPEMMKLWEYFHVRQLQFIDK